MSGVKRLRVVDDERGRLDATEDATAANTAAIAAIGTPVDWGASLSPTIGGSAFTGISTIRASYVLIGDLVIVKFFFQWTGDESANSGKITIQLPFPSDTTLQAQANALNAAGQGFDFPAGYSGTMGIVTNAANEDGDLRLHSATGSAPIDFLGTHTQSAGTKYVIGEYAYMRV